MRSNPDPQVEKVRSALPAIRNLTYLNAGTCGPLPDAAIQAMAAQAAEEAEQGRIRMELFVKKTLPAMAELRAAFARLLQATPQEIALTGNTTSGINTVIWGFPWRPGDGIAVTDLEYPGALISPYLAARKLGLDLRTVRLQDAQADDIPQRIADGLSGNTRLLLISHVCWSNGVRIPLRETVQAAHQKNCQVLIDAAQSAGTIPLALPDSGVDYYALPGQKWLCGPEGMGALYVRKDLQDALLPTAPGYFAMDFGAPHPWDCFGHADLFLDARRYEGSSIYHPAVLGMLASLSWLEREVGWEWAHARIEKLHAYAREVLSRVPGLRLRTPREAAGLLHFQLAEGFDPKDVEKLLSGQGIRIRSVPHCGCLRVSTGFWNTTEELDRLGNALREITRPSPP